MTTAANPRRRRRRAWRWIARGGLGLVGLVVATAAVVLVVIHTDWGRERIRARVEAQLGEVFVGGATIGRLEGSPFGELVARDVVINGPDGAPVIQAKTLRLRLALWPLARKQARLSSVIIEDADVRIDRDKRGEVQISRLMKPGPKSGWSVELGDLQLHRAHVSYDTGRERVNLDGVELRGSADLPFERPLRASVTLTGRWRERAVPIELEASVRAGGGSVSIEHASVVAGGVSAAADDVRIVDAATPGGAPSIAGSIRVDAPRAEVARLVPGLDLPADVSLRVEAAPVLGSAWTRVRVSGRVDGATVNAMVRADLAARRAVGFVATGPLDAAQLSRARFHGEGSLFASFDLALPGDAAPPGAELPVGNAMVHAWGTFEGVPETRIRVALTSTGERVSTIVDAWGAALRANLAAELSKRGAEVTLHRGTLTASSADPERASGGRAPVHGTIRAVLTASGTLAPRPSLAVAGTIDGRKLRFGDLAIDSLALAIDARRLPERPLGRAELKAEGITRGRMYLAELAITAADRDDGKLAVAVRTRPRRHPWLFEADALVTTGDVVAVELVRHHVRAGGGTDWRGDSGYLAIAPDRIEVRDLASRGAAGSLRLAGVYHRAGRRAGDVEARVAATEIALANVDPRYRGTADVRLELDRRGGRIAARGEVAGRGIALEPSAPPIDGRVRLDARGGRVALDGDASASGLGRVRLAAELAAPRDLANAAAWRMLGRGAIRTGRLTFEQIDVARVAALAKLEGPYAGRVDGSLVVSSTSIDGTVAVRDLVVPATDRLGPVRADLRLSQAASGELAPALTAHLEGIGPIEARATLALPDRVFDPAAWRRLGRAALVGGSIRASEIVIDPGLLDRLGIAATLRGSAAVTAELAGGARGATLAVRVRQLRGKPLVMPVDVELTAAIDGAGSQVRIVGGAAATRLLELEGRAPVTPAMLEADPRAALRAPLAATLKLLDPSAVRLAAVFGRADVIGGTLSGTATIAGTLGAPTVRARIDGANLQVTPGPGGRPIKTVDRLSLDARWDGTAGELVLDGLQRGGTLRVVAAGSARALGAATLTVRAKQFDLAPILVFLPGPAGAATGRLDADLAVTGLDPRTSKLAGELHLAHARIPISPTVGTLRRAKLDLYADPRKLRLRLDGLLGDGTVAAAGTIAIAGASTTGGDLTLTLRGVSPIGAVEPRIDADVTAKVTKAADRWIADVAVRNGHVRVPSGRGEELKPVGAPPDMVFLTGERITARPRKKERPARPVIELRVALGPTRLESEELRGVVSGKVTITADADAVGMVGSIEAERGDLDLFGRRYLVERAAVRFDGSTDPLLDLRISHDFPEVTTATTVRGRLSNPELIMTSDPSIYSQGQLLGFLLGGEPSGEPASGNPRDKVTAAGASLVANRIGGYIKRALPIDLDVLRYEAATSSSSAAVTIGSWLTDSLFVAYRRRLEARPDENTGEAEAEYWITRRVMVEGVLGDRGISGVDLLWRKRY